MKKLIALLLAACLMLGLMTTAFAADEKSNDIVILYTNDVHCAVDDNIGYAGLAAYKRRCRPRITTLRSLIAATPCRATSSARCPRVNIWSIL